MSFGGSTAAAIQSLKNNARLRRTRAFLGGADHRWEATPRPRKTASPAVKKQLHDKYQAEVEADRRNRRIGIVVGILGAWIFFYLLGYYLG